MPNRACTVAEACLRVSPHVVLVNLATTPWGMRRQKAQRRRQPVQDLRRQRPAKDEQYLIRGGSRHQAARQSSDRWHQLSYSIKRRAHALNTPT
jgi:hypothetical protein